MGGEAQHTLYRCNGLYGFYRIDTKEGLRASLNVDLEREYGRYCQNSQAWRPRFPRAAPSPAFESWVKSKLDEHLTELVEGDTRLTVAVYSAAHAPAGREEEVLARAAQALKEIGEDTRSEAWRQQQTGLEIEGISVSRAARIHAAVRGVEDVSVRVREAAWAPWFGSD